MGGSRLKGVIVAAFPAGWSLRDHVVAMAGAGLSHNSRYDIPDSAFSQSPLFRSSRPKKSLEELRVERYVSCIMSIDRILSDREAKRLSNPEALTNADYYMAQIMEIGAVDGENARTLLQEKGIDDLRRMD